MGAVLNALLFTGLCIGVWYTATQWKPWESWSSNLSNKHVTSETDGGKPTSSITVTVSEKPPGPELIWGTNELVAGKHYELSGSITMYPFLASPWKPNLVWHYEKQGEETSVYYDRIFREDGGSYIDPATDHRDGSPGNYYFIPSEDMTVRLQKSP